MRLKGLPASLMPFEIVLKKENGLSYSWLTRILEFCQFMKFCQAVGILVLAGFHGRSDNTGTILLVVVGC
jgi:hypothetical protein